MLERVKYKRHDNLLDNSVSIIPQETISYSHSAVAYNTKHFLNLPRNLHNDRPD